MLFNFFFLDAFFIFSFSSFIVFFFFMFFSSFILFSSCSPPPPPVPHLGFPLPPSSLPPSPSPPSPHGNDCLSVRTLLRFQNYLPSPPPLPDRCQWQHGSGPLWWDGGRPWTVPDLRWWTRRATQCKASALDLTRCSSVSMDTETRALGACVASVQSQSRLAWTISLGQRPAALLEVWPRPGPQRRGTAGLQTDQQVKASHEWDHEWQAVREGKSVRHPLVANRKRSAICGRWWLSSTVRRVQPSAIGENMAERVAQPAPSTDQLQWWIADRRCENVCETLAGSVTWSDPRPMRELSCHARDWSSTFNNIRVVPRSNWPVHEPKSSFLDVTQNRNAPQLDDLTKAPSSCRSTIRINLRWDRRASSPEPAPDNPRRW